ncbi:MAG: class I SAM-dependent methyltransferase, partial [Gammaproteobacteria bacterium]|nr:class I SAM-dependent methyltransferase [Gammaproteobacteria bacterium]
MSDKIERQKEHFDKIADRYYLARRQDKHLLLKNLMWKGFLSDKQYISRDGLRVLEAMCGFADGKHIIENNLGISVNYTGFDYSSTVVQKLRLEKPDLNVYQQDITEFSSNAEFDLIILLGGLHHVPDYAESAIKHLTACLVPGGYFLNLEPTHGNQIFKKIRELIYSRNHLFDEETEEAFSVEELKNLFLSAGLRMVDISFPGLLSYVLYYNPDAFPSLNIGGNRMIKATYAFDRLWMRNWIGKTLSFATLSLWQKP